MGDSILLCHSNSRPIHALWHALHYFLHFCQRLPCPEGVESKHSPCTPTERRRPWSNHRPCPSRAAGSGSFYPRPVYAHRSCCCQTHNLRKISPLGSNASPLVSWRSGITRLNDSNALERHLYPAQVSTCFDLFYIRDAIKVAPNSTVILSQKTAVAITNSTPLQNQ